MTLRTEKFEELLKRELSAYFLRETEFPKDCLVTVTCAKISSDLKLAQVWLSILPKKFNGTVLKIIKKKKRNFEKTFFRKMSAKFTPKLIFKIDDLEDRAEEVERLIEEIKNESDSTK